MEVGPLHCCLRKNTPLSLSAAIKCTAIIFTDEFQRAHVAKFRNPRDEGNTVHARYCTLFSGGESTAVQGLPSRTSTGGCAGSSSCYSSLCHSHLQKTRNCEQMNDFSVPCSRTARRKALQPCRARLAAMCTENTRTAAQNNRLC